MSARFQSSLVSLGERRGAESISQSNDAVLLLLLLLLLFSKHVPYTTRHTRPGSSLYYFSLTENDRHDDDTTTTTVWFVVQTLRARAARKPRLFVFVIDDRYSLDAFHSIQYTKPQRKTSSRVPSIPGPPAATHPNALRARSSARSATPSPQITTSLTVHNSSRWGSRARRDPPEDARRRRRRRRR